MDILIAILLFPIYVFIFILAACAFVGYLFVVAIFYVLRLLIGVGIAILLGIFCCFYFIFTGEWCS
jgi:hypothetical protein